MNNPVVGDDSEVLLVLRNVGDAEADGRQHLHRLLLIFSLPVAATVFFIVPRIGPVAPLYH